MKPNKQQDATAFQPLPHLGEPLTAGDMESLMARIGGDPERAGQMTALARFWLDLQAANPLPSRADFGPEDLKFVLPDLFMVDTGGAAMRYRLVGTRLAGRFQRDPTGHPVARCAEAWGRDSILAILRQVIHTREPHAVLARGGSPWNSYPLFQGVVMPLYGADGRVAILIGAAQFLAGVPGAPLRPTRLDMRRVVR